MKKIKFTKETFAVTLILILSAVLNFANIGIEGYSNEYYAAGVKSMLMSFKNFFFVSFDPAGFVTIDKPPVGFWIQTISAKIFGFSGWSILLPQALAGVISVWLVYYLVKRSFGSMAGLISALCLAVTPVFVAASRNNTIDNLLVVTLLFACLALSVAAEKGKLKYLIISLVLVGVGFNIKMLQAYMIGPALYITYLLSTALPVKKRIKHLALGTVILLAVSFSWAIAVDLVPAQNRPYVGSSTNNSVMELVLGHNGLERLGLGSKSTPGSGGKRQDDQSQKKSEDKVNAVSSATQETSNKNTIANNNGNSQGQGVPGGPPSGSGQGTPGMKDGNMQPPSGGGPGGNQGGGPGGGSGTRLAGSFGAETPAGITRLFSKNILSDQIVWFLPLALFGFIAGAIKEKLRFSLDNKKKLALVLWMVWLVPEFIYFSFTTGLFHPYYLTMMAPPAAALTGIGISVMWEMFRKGGWKSWILPVAFVVEGLTQLLMLSYFSSNVSTTIKNVILASLILCFAASAILAISNLIKGKKNTTEDSDNSLEQSKNVKFKKVLVGIALIGTLVTPLIGSSAVLYHSVGNLPVAGLELLSTGNKMGNFGGGNAESVNTKLVQFLKNNRTNEKYLLVVSSSQSADNIIIQTGESVMALGGFSGSDNTLTLDQFKELVKKGEVRYVLAGGMGGNSSNSIMNWVKENGKVVAESEWKDSNEVSTQDENSNKNIFDTQTQSSDGNTNKNTNLRDGGFRGPGGMNSEQLYDLKGIVQN
ncbi:glycosyltransferase family 39 protein [Clostridium thailandense]|uniref:glycosyltransferase family 39 protein n=1 Tax=Clostridium thailandense TaxID=2794346 RepID=UPI0039892CF4